MTRFSDLITPRQIEPAEEARFRKKGWSLLSGLIPRGDAGRMLAAADDILARARAQGTTGTGQLGDCWYSWDNLVFEARQITCEPFASFILSEAMGRLASRLIGRARLSDEVVPIRAFGGLLFCKIGGSARSGEAIPYHQDAPAFRMDRPGLVTVWVALDDLLPEQGTMRFLEGSHGEGALGDHRSGNTLQRYPKLTETYALSGPLAYRAGDATAHHGFTLHGSPGNVTDRPRWALLCLYVAADVEYDDSRYLAPGFLGHPDRYPIVYR